MPARGWLDTPCRSTPAIGNLLVGTGVTISFWMSLTCRPCICGSGITVTLFAALWTHRGTGRLWLLFMDGTGLILMCGILADGAPSSGWARTSRWKSCAWTSPLLSGGPEQHPNFRCAGCHRPKGSSQRRWLRLAQEVSYVGIVCIAGVNTVITTVRARGTQHLQPTTPHASHPHA